MRLLEFADTPDGGAAGAAIHRYAGAAAGSRSASPGVWSPDRYDSSLPFQRPGLTARPGVTCAFRPPDASRLPALFFANNIGPLGWPLALNRPGASTRRSDALVSGAALVSRFVLGPNRARDARLVVRASLCQHILPTLALDSAPATQPLLGIQGNLQKLHASTLRRVGDASGSPAANKSNAECDDPSHV